METGFCTGAQESGFFCGKQILPQMAFQLEILLILQSLFAWGKPVGWIWSLQRGEVELTGTTYGSKFCWTWPVFRCLHTYPKTYLQPRLPRNFFFLPFGTFSDQQALVAPLQRSMFMFWDLLPCCPVHFQFMAILKKMKWGSFGNFCARFTQIIYNSMTSLDY